MDRKEDRTAPDTFERIDLSDRKGGMILQESLIILERATDPTGLIHLDPCLFPFSGAHADGPGHIDIAGGEETVVHISI